MLISIATDYSLDSSIANSDTANHYFQFYGFTQASDHQMAMY